MLKQIFKQKNNRNLSYLLAFFSLMVVFCACGKKEENVARNLKEENVSEVVSEQNNESETDRTQTDGIQTVKPEIEEPESPEEPEVYEPQTVTICMVGDVLLHSRIEEYSVQEDGNYDYSALFEYTQDEISASDLALVNQEVIIGGEELGISGYPCFNASYALTDALVEAGFDVICHGTNHALDKGAKGVENCLLKWQEKYPEMEVIGIHDSAEDQAKISYKEINGIKLAILNFTYGTNGIQMPADKPYLVDYLEENRVIAALQEAESNADFTIVCPHWGTEYVLKQTANQEKWAKLMLDNGADLILGTHPHVIEPVEWVEGEDGKRMLCYYSLGNFVNWTAGSGAGVANRMVGGMAQVTLSKAEDGIVSVSDYGIRALVAHVTPNRNGITTYFLSDYSEELADENAIRNADGNFSYDYCVKLCDEVWGELWK